MIESSAVLQPDRSSRVRPIKMRRELDAGSTRRDSGGEADRLFGGVAGGLFPPAPLCLANASTRSDKYCGPGQQSPGVAVRTGIVENFAHVAYSLSAHKLDMSSYRDRLLDPIDVATYWAVQTPYSASRMIERAVRAADKHPADLSVDDLDLLADIDEFHCLGKSATISLAHLLGLKPGARVLDIGCGVGGPSRRLAVDFGCSVIGVDLTREYLDAAQGLSERMRLLDRVQYLYGDAIDLPVQSRDFDFVWLQVATSNIASRLDLYREIHRVLKPGGRAGVFDIIAGRGGPVRFPVPWAYDGSTSALLTEGETKCLLELADLSVELQLDVSDEACSWFESQYAAARRLGGPPPIGFHILLPQWAWMARNQVLNLREDRIRFNYLILSAH